MNNTHDTGAGTPITFFEDNIDAGFDFDLEGLAYQDALSQPSGFGQMVPFSQQHTAVPANLSTNDWQPGYFRSPNLLREHHLSTSTQSSGHSGYRSSGSSFLSDQRFSTISNISSFSNTSASSNEYSATIPEESQLFSDFPATNSYIGSPIESTANPPRGRRTTPGVHQPGKDYFKTCVSRTRQRSRRQITAQIYFCTACWEPFKEKADWKRHEEEYQERREKFFCSLCFAVYFLDKNFAHHHKSAHGCRPCAEPLPKCSEKQHVQEAKSDRKRRTGWGCGFCFHFSDNWIERCNHIAYHFDHEHKTMKQWNHSVVIYSLLQRPAILVKWQDILRHHQRHFTDFSWHLQSTGRIEGYPESNKNPQLQDLLEYFTPDQEAAMLAQWAFDQSWKRVARQRPKNPPPLPPKDNAHNPNEPLSDITNDIYQWNEFARSVMPDDLHPTGVTQISGNSQVENNFSWLDCRF